MDDIIIFSDTFEEHLDRLERVLLRLRECGLKLNPKKCSFCQEKVKYVGHIVSANGIEADPEKCDKVVNWPTPRKLPGSCNADANALSRIPGQRREQSTGGSLHIILSLSRQSATHPEQNHM